MKCNVMQCNALQCNVMKWNVCTDGWMYGCIYSLHVDHPYISIIIAFISCQIFMQHHAEHDHPCWEMELRHWPDQIQEMTMDAME